LNLSYFAGLEVLVPVLVFVAVALQKWKRGITDTWKDVAEAQSQRAELLEKQVQELTNQVKALRAENAELRSLLKAAGKSTP
jgi:cell shape-determining protein MreC